MIGRLTGGPADSFSFAPVQSQRVSLLMADIQRVNWLVEDVQRVHWVVEDRYKK